MATVPQAVAQHPIRRYSNAAVTFHWVIVALVLTQVAIGFTFAELLPDGATKDQLLTWHKTLGALILLLTLARLAYRLKNPPPPFPPELPHWRRVVAVWNHRLFYALLILLPLTGLIAVSDHGPITKLIGGISLPTIPGISGETADTSADVHVVLVYTTIALLLLHVGAAIQQQFFEHDRTAGRMPPFQAPGDERAVIGQGGAALPAEG